MIKKEDLVCIIILNWNGIKITQRCLNSLKMTDYNNYKIIVLDNGSTDNSLNILKKYKNIDLLQSNINLGYAKGLNFCYDYVLKKYDPIYIVNMNNDILTIQKDWLTLMVEELSLAKQNGICGNKLVFPDNRVQLLFYDRHPKEYLEKDFGQFDFIKTVSAVGGANMLIKTKVIYDIGGTDENYFFGPDDLDFCFRAKKAGYNIIYNGYSKSIHIGSFSYLNSTKDSMYKELAFGQILFYLRYKKFCSFLIMIGRQFLRIFLIRKNPYKKITFKNLYFNNRFVIRFFLFLKAIFKSIKNRNIIKNSWVLKR